MIVEQFISWMRTAPVPQRAQAADALARAYLQSDLGFEERMNAECALTTLLDDPSNTVRLSLANALCNSRAAPRNVILGLLGDNDEISTTILTRSPLLADGELVDIIASGSKAQQIAVACRYDISSALCGALAEVGQAESCLALLMNSNAMLTQRILTRIADRHGEDVDVRKTMLARDDLPGAIRIRLVEKLADNLSDFVVKRGWISKQRLERSSGDTLQRSTIILAARLNDERLDCLVRELIHASKMTTAFLLRSICMGNISLFSRSISALANIPADRIEAMISKGRHAAFRAAYIKAGLPHDALEVFSAALEVWQDLLSEPDWISRARMPYLVTRQVTAKFANHQGTSIVGDLLILLQRISAEMARDDARIHLEELATKRAQEKSNAIRLQFEHLVADNDEALHDASNQERIRMELEQSISEALEEQVIDLAQQDIAFPDRGANDPRITIESAKTAHLREVDNAQIISVTQAA